MHISLCSTVCLRASCLPCGQSSSESPDDILVGIIHSFMEMLCDCDLARKACLLVQFEVFVVRSKPWKSQPLTHKQSIYCLLTLIRLNSLILKSHGFQQMLPCNLHVCSEVSLNVFQGLLSTPIQCTKEKNGVAPPVLWSTTTVLPQQEAEKDFLFENLMSPICLYSCVLYVKQSSPKGNKSRMVAFGTSHHWKWEAQHWIIL